MSEPLTRQPCTACRGDVPPLSDGQAADLLSEVPGWDIVHRDGIARLERVFSFKNFAEALAFTQAVGDLAEAEDHHPALLTEWGKVTVTWWTHKIGGLHQNDFIAAAKTSALQG